MSDVTSFDYQAQTVDGRAISGSIDAASVVEACDQLQQFNLRVTQLKPVTKPILRSAMGSDDFLAFNQQLAHLSSSGMPVERGLRLMADEISNTKQADAVRAIANELEKGTPLGMAFAAHQASFPVLYGRLIDAGVRANNLPAVLFKLGRHLALVGRLKAALWRIATYPLSVLLALLLVLGFIWLKVIPQIEPMASAFTSNVDAHSTSVSGSSNSMSAPEFWIWIARLLSFGIMFCVLLVLLCGGGLLIATRSIEGRRKVEPLLLKIPLIGPILRWNLLARWCDGLHIGIVAGMDLPSSIRLACDALDSPAISLDGQHLIDVISAGQSLDDVHDTKMLPRIIPASLQMGAERSDLPDATAMLAAMYEEQAQARLAVLPAVLSPLLLLLTAVSVGIAVLSAIVPLIATIQSLTHPF